MGEGCSEMEGGFRGCGGALLQVEGDEIICPVEKESMK